MLTNISLHTRLCEAKKNYIELAKMFIQVFPKDVTENEHFDQPSTCTYTLTTGKESCTFKTASIFNTTFDYLLRKEVQNR